MDIEINSEINNFQISNSNSSNKNSQENASHRKGQAKSHNIQQKQKWSSEQIETLFNQYLQNGTCWSQMTTKIPQKSAQNIKNKFNNSLRTTSKLLNKFQKQVLGKVKQNITKDLLLTILEISNQAQKAIKFLGLTINWESKLFSFKSELLRLCLETQKLSNQRIEYMIKATNLISLKMRTYLVFKQKNIRNWKINGKAFNYILSFDQIITENLVKFPFQNQNERIIKPKAIKHQETDAIEQLRSLVTDFDFKNLNYSLSLCYLEDDLKEQQFSLFNQNSSHHFHP